MNYFIRSLVLWIVSNVLWISTTCDEYLGCFQDSTTEIILNKKSKTFLLLTIPGCINFCKGNDLMYAGMKRKPLLNPCLCDSVLHNNLSEVKLSDSECNSRCGGNPATYCGDLSWTSDVVTIQSQSTVPSTTQLTDVVEIYFTTRSNSFNSTEYSTQSFSTASSKSSEYNTSDSPEYSTSDSLQNKTSDSLQYSTSDSQKYITPSLPANSYSGLPENNTQDLSYDYASTTNTHSTTNVIMTTDEYSTPTTVQHNNVTIIENSNSCGCTCIDVESVEFLRKLEQLVRNITIDKKQTSSYITSKISVYDSRVSSATIGATGIVFISLIICLILASDIVSYCNHIKADEMSSKV